MHRVDAIVIGAGAAGLFCAGIAGQRGLRVLLIDHAEQVAEKVRISGGGRCNFTNRETTPANFLSENPHFCRSALARYTPADFIALLQRHGIGFHEKHKGQLFCDEGSGQVIQLLLAECEAGGVQRWQPCRVAQVRQGAAGGFELDTDRGPVAAASLVVATGGLSIPKIGATDFGHRLARQFGHRVVEPRPGLVPLTFEAAQWAPFVPLAGPASLPVQISAGQGKARGRFHEDLLFTHRGLSGPAVLQASSYWRPGEPLSIDLLPGQDCAAWLRAAKAGAHRPLAKVLGQHLPQRLADTWLGTLGLDPQRPCPELRDRDLQRLAEGLARWQVQPDGHRRLAQGRGDPGRRGHPRTRLAQPGQPARAGAALHRRGGGRHRLAGGLQLPMGLGQCGGLCTQLGKTSKSAVESLSLLANRAKTAQPEAIRKATARAGRKTKGSANPVETAPPSAPKSQGLGTNRYMTTIRVKENEPFDVALRRFKRTIEKLGLLTDLRAREFYEKPTAERKRKKAAAVKRHFKRVRSMQLPKKLY